MWQYVGLRRDETGLKKAQEILDTLTDKAGMGTYGDRSSMELVNMLTLAKLVTEGSFTQKNPGVVTTALIIPFPAEPVGALGFSKGATDEI